MTDATPLLRVENLVVEYRSGRLRSTKRIIDDVSLDIAPGETLGLVGESGSGKTTIGRAVLGLALVTSGRILLDGTDIGGLRRRERRDRARDVQAIFQDPYSSLNPSMSIADILAEPIREGTPASRRGRVRELLDAVGLPTDAGRRRAREFSGGQRQRIAIARALALSPRLIICDEPTSALDMSTQTRVLGLLKEIQQRTDVSYLFISHDLGVVREMSDRTAVLLGGRIVEQGTAEQIARDPQHPYSRRLQMATPVADPVLQARRREERLAMLREQAAAG
ncbi:ATP-binding cassette domain-containing protein [Streptomyces sp. NBC_00006]|uniref:ATP-binding cassette domain-containing protein n=1 Tax=unclassified Streptomyces TaxID=2593676 RepID=UPI0022559D05|nr:MULTISPECIES: ATP-binding cassette domain-containing protein [unclassified Streptomyces]MCX4834595.1 ATP-binding cassette domain-containing protein [Streptomyces sp. NBC_01016]MCX5529584.1 ATP-binding cassette domain-containing protein [Streptomyces sp. NBC_00006]